MNHDTDVLTLLRAAAVEDAPALTLQVDDLVRTGRRRRRTTRFVAVGAGAVLAAGAIAVSTTQVDRGVAPSPAPADKVTQAPSYEAHMMPALLKDVVLSGFGATTPDWKTFDIAAYGNVEGRDSGVPLPEPLWDQASRWELRGTTDDRGVELWLTAGDFSSTEGDPEQYCRARLAEGALACSNDVLADGRVIVNQWMQDDRGDDFGTAGLGGPWFIQNVSVYRAGSGYMVVARQGVQASTFEQARDDAWLGDATIRGIASNPDADLENVLGQPASRG